MDVCKSNLEKLSIVKVSEHIPSGYSMSRVSLLKDVENKQNV